MEVLHGDFETRSCADLPKCGVDVYANDPSTDILCFGYSFNDEPVQLIKLGDPLPTRIRNHIESGGRFVAHNAAFELAIWNKVCVRKYGWPKLDPNQCRCTMVMAYALGLPGSLQKVAPALGIEQQKDMAGSRVMLQLSKPKIGHTESDLWHTDQAKYEQLYRYCIQDVEVEKAVEKRLIPLSLDEHAYWVLDQEINENGIPIDTALASIAMRYVAEETKRLDEMMRKATNNEVATCSANVELSKWINRQGVKTEGVAKNDVTVLLEKEIPENVREVLLLRQEAAKSSTAKIKAMVASASKDNRIRGTMQFNAAHTGRWGGRRIQPQNFPRSTLKQHYIESFLEDLKTQSLDELSMVYGSFNGVLSQSIRGFIVAPKGNDFIVSDWAGIEARILAWLSNHKKLIKLFENNEDVYVYEARNIYGKSDISKDERQIGKVAVLALGFGGGMVAFQKMAVGYGVKISDERADDIKVKYRNANRPIVDYWYALENAAMEAVNSPGSIVHAANFPKVQYLVRGSFLLCRLPSGRVISYPYPKIQPTKTPWGDMKDALTYMCEDPNQNNKWVRVSTYGGSLCENVTQAVAADILRNGLKSLKKAGYKTIFHVHDEIITEQPIGFGSVEEVEKIMCTTPEWAKGMPLKAEGWRGSRYRK